MFVLVSPSSVFAWHDTGHMVSAQIAYSRLSPAARAEVDRLLIPVPGRRPLIHLCATYFTPACEKIYDPITIATWMDDFRGDSLNDSYDTWHYINLRPLFDGIAERPNVGPLPANVLDRLIWSINTLRAGTGSDKRDAEVLGFLYHLAGDAHQPMHATTRYSAARPEGDAGGNGFAIRMPSETGILNLHMYWDAAAGLFGWENPRRPLDDANRERIRHLADELVGKYPADSMPESRDKDPYNWVIESNALARKVAYVGIRERDSPAAAYTEQAQATCGRRIALAGYRLAAVLNEILVRPQPSASKRSADP
jgi:hypothetical protein